LLVGVLVGLDLCPFSHPAWLAHVGGRCLPRLCVENVRWRDGSLHSAEIKKKRLKKQAVARFLGSRHADHAALGRSTPCRNRFGRNWVEPDMAGCSIKTDRAGRFEWNRTSLPDIDMGILISTDMVRWNGLHFTTSSVHNIDVASNEFLVRWDRWQGQLPHKRRIRKQPQLS
jgi:hypothetical protein